MIDLTKYKAFDMEELVPTTLQLIFMSLLGALAWLQQARADSRVYHGRQQTTRQKVAERTNERTFQTQEVRAQRFGADRDPPPPLPPSSARALRTAAAAAFSASAALSGGSCPCRTCVRRRTSLRVRVVPTSVV